MKASVLAYSVFHSLGDDTSFFKKYAETKTNPEKKISAEDILALDFSSLKSLLPNANLRRVPKYAKMGLISALNTLNKVKIPCENTALVIGTAFSSSQMNIDFMDSILDNSPELSSPTAFSHAVNNMGAGLISLLLNIEGGCQTITQFDLSFAGALQTALLLLHSGKNDYVLLGAIDETDARFTKACEEYVEESLPLEGAVFFLLAREGDNSLSLSWESEEIFLSGEINSSVHFVKESSQFNPLAHALDLALALYLNGNGKKEERLCSCTQCGKVATLYIS